MPRIRLSGALLAVVALTALAAIGPPGVARAATTTGTGYDQISGIGSTDSAITVPWAQGLLDSSNQPIAGANAVRSSPSGPLAFMYSDPGIKNLQVTVSQTQNITHQGITISWTGGGQTVRSAGSVAGNFLQIMECYSANGASPSPQDCEFGAGSQLGSGIAGFVGTRSGDLCPAGSSPVVGSPPGPGSGGITSLNDQQPSSGCDPEEPVQGASASDVDPGDSTQYDIPFVPAGGCAAGSSGCPAYGTSDTNQYFTQFDTNEVDAATTNSSGTGQLQFETLTDTQAPGLGCGQEINSQPPPDCWLVIVPRGTYEPNGYQINPEFNGAAGLLLSSPLSASNWAMRIQIHLAYAPLGSFCPPGTNETEVVGTQVIARAVQSWQLALNNAAKCTTIYGYSAVPEATSTQQLAAGAVGLAFTTIPIGSEASRPGGGGGTFSLPPIVYAPVAVSAVGFGFNINLSNGYVTTPVNLSPELLAKALTQVYLYDLPDYYPTPTAGNTVLGPAAAGGWANGNPTNITQDGQFQRVNPGLSYDATTVSLAPLLTEDHSALNQQIWQWIQADPGAAAWLNQGTPDSANFDTVSADPDYTTLQLGTAPAIDSFPRAYSACLDAGTDSSLIPPKEITRCSLDLLPYVADYDTAAADILSANNPVITNWNSTDIAPDGTNGWWDKNPPEAIGSRFVWGISDTGDLAAYGLIDAQLCDDAGNNCVAPTTASLTAALDSAKPDSAGLLEVNPADPGAGGYPLTQVTYAAVATNQSAADLTADANLIAYAADQGQTPGAAPGDLPPGYLPMTASLQAQAMSVVAQLRADATGSPSPSAAASAGSAGSTGTATSGGTTPANIAGQSVSSTSPAAGPSISPPSAQLAATRTRPQPVGAIRWVLLAVFIAGAACAAGGTVLRSAGVARWLRRMRP